MGESYLTVALPANEPQVVIWEGHLLPMTMTSPIDTSVRIAGLPQKIEEGA